MNYIVWCINKFNRGNNLRILYNIKRNEMGIYDKKDGIMLKMFAVNIDVINDLLKSLLKIKFYGKGNEFKVCEKF